MIIHKLIKRKECFTFPGLGTDVSGFQNILDFNYVLVNSYLCNAACGITNGKYSYHWKNVTCKNCLKGRK